MKKVVIAIIIVVASVVSVVCYLYGNRGRAVVFEYIEPGSPLGEPNISFFNPFRERGPEMAAEAFLSALRSGDTEKALSLTSLSSRPAWLVREREVPLQSWVLRGRKDQVARARLYYDIQRLRDPKSPAWLDLIRVGGEWTVESYESWY